MFLKNEEQVSSSNKRLWLLSNSSNILRTGWAIVAIIVFIIVFSALFELCNHSLLAWLKKQKLTGLVHMLNSMFKELTILGFISLLLFTAVRSGAAQILNDAIFGQNKTEKTAIKEALKKGETPAPPTVLQELFEEIHILIFAIMVIYIFEASFLLMVGRSAIRGFERLDHLSISDFHQMNELDEHSQYDGENLTKQALAFYCLKFRFLFPTVTVFPAPHDPEFKFSKYLSEHYTELLVELIELPVIALFFIFFIVLVLRPIMGLSGVTFLISLVVVAIVLLCATISCFYIVHKAYCKLVPNLHSVSRYLHGGGSFDIRHGTSNDLFKATIDNFPVFQKTPYGPKNRIERQLPLCSLKIFCTVLQLLLFFNAAFAAVIVRGTCTIAHHQSLLWWEHRFWSYPLTLGAVIVNLALWIRLIREFNYLTCLDCQANHKTIEEVEEELDKEQLEHYAHLLRFLFHKAHHADLHAKSDEQQEVEMERVRHEFHNLPPHYQDLLTIIFTTVSRYHERIGEDSVKGVIMKSDIWEALRVMGRTRDNTSDYIVTTWFNDCAKSAEGYLTFTGFVQVIMLSTNLADLRKDPKEVAALREAQLRSFFTQLDENKDDKISIPEFKKVFEGLTPPPTQQEIEKLVARISRGDTSVTFNQLFEFVDFVSIRTGLTMSLFTSPPNIRSF